MDELFEPKNSEELILRLSRKKKKLAKWFDSPLLDIEQVVVGSAAGSVFMAFPHMPRRPSHVYREWARRLINSRKSFQKIRSISSQAEYDVWHIRRSRNLRKYWKTQMHGREIGYGPARKLLSLLMKQLVRYEGLTPRERQRLIRFLHVPFDKYTLRLIRNCTEESPSQRDRIGFIPKSASMGHVKNKRMYDGLQQVYRRIAKRAGMPPIYLDVFAWNEQH